MNFSVEYNREIDIPEGLYGDSENGKTEIHYPPNSREKRNLINTIPYSIHQVNATIQLEGGCGYQPPKDFSESIQGEVYIHCDLDGDTLEDTFINNNDKLYTKVFYPFLRVDLIREYKNIELNVTKIEPEFPKPISKIIYSYNGKIKDLRLDEKHKYLSSVIADAIDRSYCIECNCHHFYDKI